MTGPDFLSLWTIGEHNENSHEEDRSKFLKHAQIVEVTDAVTIAPATSGAVLRRNMQLTGPSSPEKNIGPDMLRCVQRVVKASCAQLTVKQLQGFDIDSSFADSTQQYD